MPTLPFSFTCPAAFSPRPGALVDRFRSSNHIDAIGLVGWAKRSVPTIVVSAWARRQERAFAHPTDWFHGIDPLVVHTAHAAHAAARHSRGPTFLPGPFGDHGFRGDQKPGDRRCVLQRRPHDLGRVDDAFADEIDVLAVLGVEAVGVLVFLEDLAD